MMPEVTSDQDAAVRESAEDRGELRKRLSAIWGRRRGFAGWLSVTTHQAIGLRYVITAFVFL